MDRVLCCLVVWYNFEKKNTNACLNVGGDINSLTKITSKSHKKGFPMNDKNTTVSNAMHKDGVTFMQVIIASTLFARVLLIE